jgi:hypothetical protein
VITGEWYAMNNLSFETFTPGFLEISYHFSAYMLTSLFHCFVQR